MPVTGNSDEPSLGEVAAAPDPGDVSVFFDRDTTLVRLFGEIDAAIGPDLEFAGRDAIDRGVPIVLDLAATTFIDSIGIGFIARLAACEQAAGRLLRVTGATRPVQQLLQVSGLLHLLALDS